MTATYSGHLWEASHPRILPCRHDARRFLNKVVGFRGPHAGVPRHRLACAGPLHPGGHPGLSHGTLWTLGAIGLGTGLLP